MNCFVTVFWFASLQKQHQNIFTNSFDYPSAEADGNFLLVLFKMQIV